MQDKAVIVIAGATATGKTAAAIEVASRYHTEIISADSRQCYRELNIGVARPSPAELAAVPHHFIASHSIHEKITAGVFASYALEKAAQIFSSRDMLVMAGGTGLYIRAFCGGLDEIPEIPPQIREQIAADYEKYGMPWLQRQVAETDPIFYSRGEVQNPHRLMRALEVKRATGRSVMDFRTGQAKPRDFKVRKMGILLTREELRKNIGERVERMFANGLLEEVRELIPYQHLPALQTVGYRELFRYFRGDITLEAAREEIRKNTWQYARRQLTWFRKDPEFTWYHSGTELAQNA